MKFCHKCGTVLMPKEKGKHTWLVCSECGSYKKLKEEENYKKGERKDNENNVAVIEEEKDLKIEEPDYDIDTDAYEDIYEEGY